MNGIGIGSGIISQSKNSLPVPFKLRAKKMAAVEEKLAEARRLAEAVRQLPVLYDKSCRNFKDNSKKRLAWDDVVKQVGLQTGMYSSSEYSFICSMFSLVRIMQLYGCSFLEFFRLSINYGRMENPEIRNRNRNRNRNPEPEPETEPELEK